MKIKYLMPFLLLFITSPAKADFDVSGIIGWLKNIYGIENENLPTISKNTQETVNHIKQQTDMLLNNLNGHHGFGNLLNDVRARQWSPDSWIETLQGVGGENTRKLKEAQESYAKLYPVNTADKVTEGLPKDSLLKSQYEQKRQISQTALAASKINYDSINEHIRRVNTILEKLESPDAKTEKGAIDLNTRLVAELSFIQLDILKLQSIQTQVSATQMQTDVNGLSDQANFLNMK